MYCCVAFRNVPPWFEIIVSMLREFNCEIYPRKLWIATSWEDVKDKFTTYGGYEFKKSEDAYATTYPQFPRVYINIKFLNHSRIFCALSSL